MSELMTRAKMYGLGGDKRFVFLLLDLMAGKILSRRAEMVMFLKILTPWTSQDKTLQVHTDSLILTCPGCQDFQE